MTTTATATTTAAVLISLLILSLQTTSLAIGEDAHLIEFKDSLRQPSALDSTWIAGTDPCDRKNPWLGVDCSDADFKKVSALLLMNLGLSNNAGGGIHVNALTKLDSLRMLSLENNSLSGPMPEFNRLSSLKSLFLSENQFSGEIPQDFFNIMRSLKKLELGRNNFSGLIPESLVQLDSVMEILLQDNHFSGRVPSLEQKSLEVIDLSNNNLDGEIPKTMSRFPTKAFAGNPNLCGPVVSRPCKPLTTTAPAVAGKTAMASGATTKWVILIVVVGLLLMTILFKKKERSEMFMMIGKENSSGVVADHDRLRAAQVHAPSINRRTMSSNRRGGHYSVNVNGDDGSSRRGRRRSGKSGNEIVMLNEEKGAFVLTDLMKAAAEVLGNSGLGSAYKATMGNGMAVVVKRVRGMNKLNRDVFEAEIRRLGRIRHRNILPPLAYHFRKEEKLLVTEFVPKGSLLYLLHGTYHLFLLLFFKGYFLYFFIHLLINLESK